VELGVLVAAAAAGAAAGWGWGWSEAGWCLLSVLNLSLPIFYDKEKIMSKVTPWGAPIAFVAKADNLLDGCG
jgi:hypothetical protein